jgi:hypothetical protein
MIYLMNSAGTRFIQLPPHLQRDQTEQVRAALARHHGTPQQELDTDPAAFSCSSPRDFNHAMLALHLLR